MPAPPGKRRPAGVYITSTFLPHHPRPERAAPRLLFQPTNPRPERAQIPAPSSPAPSTPVPIRFRATPPQCIHMPPRTSPRPHHIIPPPFLCPRSSPVPLPPGFPARTVPHPFGYFRRIPFNIPWLAPCANKISIRSFYSTSAPTLAQIKGLCTGITLYLCRFTRRCAPARVCAATPVPSHLAAASTVRPRLTPRLCRVFHAHVAPSSTTRALMPPLASALSRTLPGPPSSHTRPPPVSIPLRRSPPAARAGPIKPLSPYELTPSVGSLARLPAAASEHPQPPHPSSSQPPLFTCPQSMVRLPTTPMITSRRCYAIGAPHACVRMRLLSFSVHTPLRYDRAYDLPCSFGSHILPHPAASPFPHSFHPDIPAHKFLNSTITTGLPSQSCRILLFFCLRLESPTLFRLRLRRTHPISVFSTAGTPEEPAWVFGGRVAYCPQTTSIQNASLPDNMLFGRPWDEDKYWHGDLTEMCVLPMRGVYKWRKGHQSSGGQKQRVNIARALHYDTEVVLFDDPLSAVRQCYNFQGGRPRTARRFVACELQLRRPTPQPTPSTLKPPALTSCEFAADLASTAGPPSQFLKKNLHKPAILTTILDLAHTTSSHPSSRTFARARATAANERTSAPSHFPGIPLCRLHVHRRRSTFQIVCPWSPAISTFLQIRALALVLIAKNMDPASPSNLGTVLLCRGSRPMWLLEAPCERPQYPLEIRVVYPSAKIITSRLIGDGMAGIMRMFLVYLTFAVYPQVMPTVRLFESLHHGE
ncbi:hypothetical protein DFH08DRAFT_976899 [Mycena albidolilacea]|uniref:ABC transporter domain-containing protein n=1 Tax=Mycena albidolilacea TaxID=1033008 RepID=A0AAD6Z2A1_9AGAR|nr:hypothetical protein DFH08DRAFT_976899 [Mycena albidolilacea]